MPENKWLFHSTVNKYDFNDPGMQHFAGNVEKHLGRESVQNSIDAKQNEENPVKVVFERLEVPTKIAIPEIADFKKILTACESWTQEREDEKGNNFFENALKILSKPFISILKISDYNTEGLVGINDENTRWDRLITTIGGSHMEGAGGGTFGIGKFAPFNSSQLRSVAYSTKTSNGNNGFIIKSILTSFKMDGILRENRGFYCRTNSNESIVNGLNKDSNIPDWCRRIESGLDLCILGYKPSDVEMDGWIAEVMYEIMNDYFIAIYDNELRVEFKDDTFGRYVILNKENIYETMRKAYKRDIKNIGNFPMLDAYKNPDKVFEDNLDHIGSSKLYFKKNSEYNSRDIAHLRKPKMVVYNQSNRILSEPYAALFLCTNDVGNNKLSLLEPPAHDAWQAKRDPINGPKITRSLRKFVNDSLRSIKQDQEYFSTSIANIEQFLGYFDENAEVKTDDPQEGTIPQYKDTGWEEVKVPVKNPKKQNKPEKVKEFGGIGSDEDIEGSGEQGEIEKPGEGEFPGEKGAGLGPGGSEDSREKIEEKYGPKMYDYRIFYNDSTKKYRLIFKPKPLDLFQLYFFARSLTNNREIIIRISEAINGETGEEYEVQNNKIKNIDFREGDFHKIVIDLKTDTLDERLSLNMEVFGFAF